MTRTTTSADGSTIAFDTTGSGPALILLGGAFSTRRSGEALAHQLADRFTVVTVDRRGRGDSTDTSGGDTTDVRAATGREVADVRAVVEAVGGTARLYGHSSGAALALEAAAALPDIPAVIGYEPPYPTGTQRGDGTDDTGDRVRAAVAAGDSDGAARLFLTGIGMDAAAAASAPWWTGMVATAHTLPYEFALTDAGLSDRLGAIRARVLLLAGGDSPAWMRDAVDETASRIPHAETRILPGQAHNAQDDALVPVLRAFLLSS